MLKPKQICRREQDEQKTIEELNLIAQVNVSGHNPSRRQNMGNNESCNMKIDNNTSYQKNNHKHADNAISFVRNKNMTITVTS